MHHDHGRPEEDQLSPIGDIRIWSRLLGFIGPQWKWVSLALALSLIITLTGLALPRLIQLGMDNYILHVALSQEERVNGLTQLGIIFLGVILLGFAANFLQVVILEWAGQNIMHSIRQRLFAHILDLSLSFYHNHPVGRLVTRLTNDIQNLHEMFTSVMVTLFNEGVRLVGILVILFWMNWRLSLMLSITFPFMALITLWFGRLSRDAFRQIRSHLGNINAFLQEAVSGISIIQLFLRERDIQAKFGDLNDSFCRAAFYQIRVFGFFMPLIDVMNSIAIALIVWYGGGEIIQGAMTLGILTAFISYIRLFFQPLRELSQKYSIIQSAMVSAERILQILETSDSTPEAKNPVTPEKTEGAITFKKVKFEYEPGVPVLMNLSLEVHPGETLAVVGPTGSGKTTLINLLERFYDPCEGLVSLDGVDVRDLDVRWLREQIGLVMQDVFIVPDTLRNNILLDRQATDEDLERMIHLSQLSSLLEDLPQGMETRIGEGGMDLSAGQKQLLAFARVLARDPRILVLDEATANVDTETEMLIEKAIQAALSNRTSIVIAHRLSTIRRADRIVLMDHGHIVEQGTHESLMEQKGAYYHLQTLEGADHL